MHRILCAFDVVVCAIFSSHHRNLFNAKICFMHSTITMTMLKLRIFYIYFPNQKLKLQVTAQTCWHWNIVPLFFPFFYFYFKTLSFLHQNSMAHELLLVVEGGRAIQIRHWNSIRAKFVQYLNWSQLWILILHCKTSHNSKNQMKFNNFRGNGKFSKSLFNK